PAGRPRPSWPPSRRSTRCAGEPASPVPRGGPSTPHSSRAATAPAGSSRPSGSCSAPTRGRAASQRSSRGEPIMNAAVYARVSTERQGRDQTIDSQLDALRDWARDRGYELDREHVYIDEGYSGSRLDRPALDRLRDAAREGELDAVGVYSPDR